MFFDCGFRRENEEGAAAAQPLYPTAWNTDYSTNLLPPHALPLSLSLPSFLSFPLFPVAIPRSHHAADPCLLRAASGPAWRKAIFVSQGFGDQIEMISSFCDPPTLLEPSRILGMGRSFTSQGPLTPFAPTAHRLPALPAAPLISASASRAPSLLPLLSALCGCCRPPSLE